jgi:hypothetical protein
MRAELIVEAEMASFVEQIDVVCAEKRLAFWLSALWRQNAGRAGPLA